MGSVQHGQWPRLAVATCMFALILFAVTSIVGATEPRTVGLRRHDARSFDGYTLFSNLFHPVTYLIDSDGNLVHSWASSENRSGISEYLLEDGTLLQTFETPLTRMQGGGQTGGVYRYAWDGTPVWKFTYSTEDVRLHHDFEMMPNGNVLMIAWEYKTEEEAIEAGRDPDLLTEGALFPEHIIEVMPTGHATGEIIWEWHMWDHLIQDVDATKDNFGVVGDHPELIDVNYFDAVQGDERDWIHMNAVDYNEEFDQILLSARDFSEMWIIDHSTTTEEAAGHTGGARAKGGDLLYRWGNPQAYDRGDPRDQRFFLQHDVQWIPPGYPGEGNILTFNNGDGRPEGNISSVDEITPPVDASGNYALPLGEAYGPEDFAWAYQGAIPTNFYSQRQSGAERLPNGNTLINAAMQGHFFEVTTEGDIVWSYISPVSNSGPITQGEPSFGLLNFVFRAHRYGPDYSGLAGKDLTPLGPIERPKPTPLPTDTPTATPTATPTPVRLVVLPGDANCDGDVNSIDAAVILQFSAGLADLPRCPLSADANGSGDITSIDATLVLQAVAGLVQLG